MVLPLVVLCLLLFLVLRTLILIVILSLWLWGLKLVSVWLCYTCSQYLNSWWVILVHSDSSCLVLALCLPGYSLALTLGYCNYFIICSNEYFSVSGEMPPSSNSPRCHLCKLSFTAKWVSVTHNQHWPWSAAYLVMFNMTLAYCILSLFVGNVFLIVQQLTHQFSIHINNSADSY